ncbi:hypothetical protein CR513_52440, partial [Mucuna pruriens]
MPYFDSQHYDHWSELMENLLRLEKFRIEDHKVKHYLFRVIDRSVFEQILDRSTPKIEFEVLEITNIETIIEYFARVMVVANKMRSNRENMLDSKVVERILRTLTA